MSCLHAFFRTGLYLAQDCILHRTRLAKAPSWERCGGMTNGLKGPLLQQMLSQCRCYVGKGLGVIEGRTSMVGLLRPTLGPLQ